MLKLYKQTSNGILYWETWEENRRTGLIHWGTIGNEGEQKLVKSGFLSSYKKEIQKEEEQKRKDGYAEWEEEKDNFLEIEYIIEGFGTDEDLDKLQRLEARMNDLLGWTGLGHADGNSIGSGTMEVGCIVVDFDIAKKVIEENLAGTEFGNYSKIFRMSTDENE